MKKSKHMIKVIAAIVDEKQLTLYQQDGSTLSILQGDPRLAVIVRQITPILASHSGAVAEVDINLGESHNAYKAYEEEFGLGIRFFKVAKKSLADFFGLSDSVSTVTPQLIGKIPEPVTSVKSFTYEKIAKATEEIIKNAKPANHPEFHDRDTGKDGDSTIVAMVANTIITDMEKLKPQITHAIATKSAKGFNAFMTRVSACADKRRHSVEDLIKFLERGDLPIADDGSIIIYKALNRTNAGLYQGGTPVYVDIHSGKITQKVGSYVCMDPAMVDPNRSQDCSNGLHVARRGYLESFKGDVVVLAKVRPEDVIAVPLNNANKMRVCGYHILFELSDTAYSLLKANKPFTDNKEAQLLLGRALSGDHESPIEEVRITEGNGGGLKITPILEGKLVKAALPKVEPRAVEALVDPKDPDKLDAPKVNPLTVAKEVAKGKALAESRREKALRLHGEFKQAKTQAAKKLAAQSLLDHKKSVKLGWLVLGLDEETGKLLQDTLS